MWGGMRNSLSVVAARVLYFLREFGTFLKKTHQGERLLGRKTPPPSSLGEVQILSAEGAINFSLISLHADSEIQETTPPSSMAALLNVMCCQSLLPLV